MPELPEVEFARRCLVRWARGRRLVGVDGLGEVSSKATTARGLSSLIKTGARLVRFERLGKNLFLGFDDEAPVWLWSHLGMTGKWLRTDAEAPPPRFSRARLKLDDGQVLHFCDLRRFGALELMTEAERTTTPTLSALGPDLLSRTLTPARFATLLRARKVPVKPLLLDQTCVAGAGNIQASEGLWRARIDPRARPKDLDDDALHALLAALRASCRDTLASFGREARRGRAITYVEENADANPFQVYGREGEPCPRCRTLLVRFVQGGRSTFACPSCQMGRARSKR